MTLLKFLTVLVDVCNKWVRRCSPQGHIGRPLQEPNGSEGSVQNGNAVSPGSPCLASILERISNQ